MHEIMNSTEDIVSIMETFREIRNPLSATPSSSSRGPYTSYILNVDTGGLYIDQLIPNSGNYLVQPGQEIDVRSTYKGISYLFRSRHISREVDGKGFPYHHVSLPTQVEYSEKRSGYRIPIKRDERPTFHMSVAQGETYLAMLENISNSGAYLRLREQHSPLELNSLVYCNFDLSGFGSLCCQAVIRHQKQLSKTQETMLGIEFWQLPESALRELQKAVMRQQRRNIRTYLPG